MALKRPSIRQTSLAGLTALAVLPAVIVMGSVGSPTEPIHARLLDAGNSGTVQCSVTEIRTATNGYAVYTEPCSDIPSYDKNGPCQYIWDVLPSNDGPYGRQAACSHT